MVNYKINVYLKHTEMENMYVREFIELVTQDINGNNFEFTVYEDDNVYDLTNKRVTMVVKSDSGTVIQENCQVVDAKRGKATITLPPDMLIENGPYMAEVQIWEGVSRVTTLPFDYTVRLSLENDESIKADPRFSLLQVALQNVNDADGKSKEALKLSKEAKAICDDLVPKANTAAQNAQTALDRAESVVTQEELAQKVMLDGKDTKFDFINNKVVQDGLIAEAFDNTPKSMSIKRASHYTIQFVGKLDTAHPAYSAVFGMYSTSGETGYYYADAPNENSMNLRLRLGGNVYNGIDAHTNYKDLTNTMCNFLLDIDVENSITTLMINGVAKTFNQYESRPLDDTFTLYLLQTLIGGSKFKGEVKGLLVYDRALNQQEIQHNFSVLNNKPSIKELHTTDSTGKTSILKLASDTDHVEDRAGRTQEQINRTFYKRMCKEMPSQNGEPITVKNGEEGYVLSAEIKGNTQLFKRAKGSQDEWIVIPNDEGRDTVAFEYKLDSTQAIISNNGEKYPIYATEEDKANKKVISLGGVGGVYDTLEILEDGSVVYIQNTIEKLFDGEDGREWLDAGTSTTEYITYYQVQRDAKNGGDALRVICDKATGLAAWKDPVQTGCSMGTSDQALYLSFKKTDVPTKNDVNAYLSKNPYTIKYQLATPIVTHIPKELVPTILTHKTNILEAGGAVKPSSFKVTVPVDKLAEIEARLQALESTTVDVVLNK